MLPVIVIPAYQPGGHFVPLVDALAACPDQHLIIVDDGSSPACQPLFDHVGSLQRVHVLRHAVNRGKGQALKTAFGCFLETFGGERAGVVTADADGQHLVEDVLRVRDALVMAPDALCLGTRRLQANVPWKSAFGNSLTRRLFRRLTGRAVEDTQTGLRGIPAGFLPDLVRLRATGYDFELEMLLLAVMRGMPIQQVPIATVYGAHDAATHFSPVRDSLKVYRVFGRFLLDSAVNGFRKGVGF